ncbi:MAG: ATP synthase subunit c [Chloroflexi bacterium ADurb.Bin180]|nr:MAG: ATP synthase subunit c [Chloroflexi bacterium ADurb.Bin180]HNR97613.1 ATP synthase F0 subunit C [Anaerolineae bacterium]HOU23313.1 ATP synthase F0 subunit C [Anaerolineae bacterium]HQJ50981.1 ATP synthase F0 subunit C [Anaerolineae bacterium]
MDSKTLVTLTTIVCASIGVVLGSVIPCWMEGRAAEKALEGIARQPEAADRLRATLFIAMALIETGAIYALLVALVLIFANPLLTRFF